MSASGPTRKSAAVSVRSVLLPGPDTVSRTGDVRKVPEADIVLFDHLVGA